MPAGFGTVLPPLAVELAELASGLADDHEFPEVCFRVRMSQARAVGSRGMAEAISTGTVECREPRITGHRRALVEPKGLWGNARPRDGILWCQCSSAVEQMP